MILFKRIRKPLKKCFFALGTINTISIFDKADEKITDAAMQSVYDIERKMSIFKEDSDVSKINMNAGCEPCFVSEETYFAIKEAIKYSKLTEKAMDITIKPLVDLWRNKLENANIPADNEINAAKKLVNIEDIILEDKKNTVLLKNKGQSIDLGSIAKGFAADRVKSVLEDNQIKNAVINLGGNVIVMGEDSAGKPWTVGIQNPYEARGTAMGKLSLSNKSVVTSGGYEHFTEISNIKYHHILDTKTGYPAESDIKSVSIIADKSLIAEGLSTGLFVIGLASAKRILKSIPEVDAVIITKDDQVYLTEGIADIFTVIDDKFHYGGLL